MPDSDATREAPDDEMRASLNGERQHRADPEPLRPAPLTREQTEAERHWQADALTEWMREHGKDAAGIPAVALGADSQATP